MPSALAIFTCRPNSHPFQERHVYLDEPIKIGRSVARCRPAQNNATFDCKVLSRNHALVWFDHKTGKGNLDLCQHCRIDSALLATISERLQRAIPGR
ncbi:sarcolemma associated protein [Homo sapiens]|uniref:Sarcolemma associated protein n=1 Tax=Homo sapiens TaxID=9606 RepID=A0A590UK66_HUMAN|nr:sarcolemma associated protein [Homo sapiens]KAI4030233.1 sarcolemma associated protein [Homo sapiens]